MQKMQVGAEVKLQTMDGVFSGVVMGLNRQHQTRQKQCLALRDGKF